MRKTFLTALLIVLTATVGYAAGDDIVVSGVVYTWHENSSTHEYGYVAAGWDETTPIQSLHIHGMVNGYQVYGINDRAFVDNNDIIYLTIDEGITSIGQNAFARCSNLEVAILPESLETINEEAFAYCSSLKTMVIPSTVKEIQSHAFSGCTSVTDVYFLMDASQLADFTGWWDGTYHEDPQQAGGMEFNTNQHTVIHVPKGTLQAYVDSQKFVAWLSSMQEDNNRYPLWWIVNYGVVGRTYTVSDALTAVYVDVQGGLYAKDDNHWLTPDLVLTDEIDFMKKTGLMNSLNNTYDQSNWVVLSNVESPQRFKDHTIEGGTITGKLLDKMNPAIELTSTIEPSADYHHYEPCVYIPCSFMGRAQVSKNDNENTHTYAFVQPKPLEYIKVDWAVYYGDNQQLNQFYIPSPENEGINLQKLKGGFNVEFQLYEQGIESVPVLEEQGAYSFNAINRRGTKSSEEMTRGALMIKDTEFEHILPYSDGGVSDKFLVFPLELPGAPIPTSINTINASATIASDHYYSIDGRDLGTTPPTTPGIYIHNNRLTVVRH